jgi:hypothetical protein
MGYPSNSAFAPSFKQFGPGKVVQAFLEGLPGRGGFVSSDLWFKLALAVVTEFDVICFHVCVLVNAAAVLAVL